MIHVTSILFLAPAALAACLAVPKGSQKRGSRLFAVAWFLPVTAVAAERLLGPARVVAPQHEGTRRGLPRPLRAERPGPPPAVEDPLAGEPDGGPAAGVGAHRSGGASVASRPRGVGRPGRVRGVGPRLRLPRWVHEHAEFSPTRPADPNCPVHGRQRPGRGRARGDRRPDRFGRFEAVEPRRDRRPRPDRHPSLWPLRRVARPQPIGPAPRRTLAALPHESASPLFHRHARLDPCDHQAGRPGVLRGIRQDGGAKRSGPIRRRSLQRPAPAARRASRSWAGFGIFISG